MSLLRRLPLFALLGTCMALTTSCQVVAPIVSQALSVPFQLAGSLLQMAASNPIGTAAAAAAF